MRAFYDQEHCKAVLLASAIAFAPIKYAFSEFILANTSLRLASGMTSVPLWVILGIFYIWPFIQKIKVKKDMVFFLLFLLLGFIPFLIGNPEEMVPLVKTLHASLLMAFPCYIVARSLKNYKLLENYLFSASYVITVSMLYVMYRQIQAHTSKDWYSMTMAYMVLPGAMLALRLLFRHFSIKTLLNCLVSFAILLFCGTRGPLVCYAFFLLYEIAINGSFTRKLGLIKMIKWALLLIFFAAGMIYIYHERLDVIKTVISMGLSSRNFEALSNGVFFAPSTRANIYSAALEVMSKHPFIGSGVLLDRKLIRQEVLLAGGVEFFDPKDYLGSYSHLVFLDWLVEYGIFIGGFISFMFLVLILNVFLMPRGVQKSCMEFFFFCGVVPMLFSIHWLESKLFYLFLGLSISLFWEGFSKESADRRK